MRTLTLLLLALSSVVTQAQRLDLFKDWTPSKDKKDASIFIFGSALAGAGTKPLYILDMKIDYQVRKEDQSLGTTKPCSISNQNVKLSGTLVANATSEAPVDRSDIDPDAITGGLLFDCTRPFYNLLGRRKLKIYQEFRLNGEFARKFPVSNFVASAIFRTASVPVPGPRGSQINIYPFGGFEAGHNLNKPGLLFKQRVDLSRYNSIARVVAGVRGGWYFLKPDPAKDNLFRLALEYNFTGRSPLAAEPFVRARYIPGLNGFNTRQKVTEVNRAYRPSAEASATWAVTDLFGVRFQYRYGSLPPLFEFTDHQASIGITFKAKQPTR